MMALIFDRREEARMNAELATGQTPLYLAGTHMDYLLAALLVERGWTPIYQAHACSLAGVRDLLAAKGAKATAKDKAKYPWFP